VYKQNTAKHHVDLRIIPFKHSTFLKIILQRIIFVVIKQSYNFPKQQTHIDSVSAYFRASYCWSVPSIPGV